MPILRNKDYNIFENLVSLTQADLRTAMSVFLNKKYDKVYATDKFIFAVGNIPIGLVAHMDTVHKTPVKNLYYDVKKEVLWSPDGLGADDRAGVFIIIKLINAGFKPSIILTTDEEIGGIGATELAKYECPVKLKYLIQLDRRGSEDCVFYDLDNDDFVKYIESFGFKENFGSFSDISVLCPAWEICGVNLSVGYLHEHSYSELLHVDDMFATIEKVKNMLSVPEEEIPDFEWAEFVNYGYGLHGYDWHNYFYPKSSQDNTGLITTGSTLCRCKHCKKSYSELELIPIKLLDRSGTAYYCQECYADDSIGWCENCGCGFEKKWDDKIGDLCPECEEQRDLLIMKLKEEIKGGENRIDV